jgi:hypothetical protein
MNRKVKVRLAVAVAVMMVAVSGCGGGGGGYSGANFPAAATATTDPQVSESAYDKFIAYLKELVQTAQDNAEPADVTAFDPAPVSDVAEPVALQ